MRLIHNRFTKTFDSQLESKEFVATHVINPGLMLSSCCRVDERVKVDGVVSPRMFSNFVVKTLKPIVSIFLPLPYNP